MRLPDGVAATNQQPRRQITQVKPLSATNNSVGLQTAAEGNSGTAIAAIREPTLLFITERGLNWTGISGILDSKSEKRADRGRSNEDLCILGTNLGGQQQNRGKKAQVKKLFYFSYFSLYLQGIP